MRSLTKRSSDSATGICIFRFIGFILLLAVSFSSCTVQSSEKYFGKINIPQENVLRYISGAEIESLDPQVSDGQPDARIFMALYEGLVEYDPKTLQPIPEIAKAGRLVRKLTNSCFTFGTMLSGVTIHL